MSKDRTTPAFAFETGFVCGRFYPYHAGHRFLIEAALEQSAHVWVCVCQRKEQTVDGETRADWIRESFSDEADRLTVLVLDQEAAGLPDRDSALWAQAAKDLLGFEPDAVFTGETYQRTYAEYLHAQIVLVDSERKARPISATAIREDLGAHTDFLEPHVLEAIAGIRLRDDTHGGRPAAN